MKNMANSVQTYTSQLHWIIFFKAVVIFVIGLAVELYFGQWFGLPLIGFALVWGIFLTLEYLSSSLQVTPEFITMQTGILVRKNLTVSRRQLETVDITQSVFGSLFNYGSLSVSGSGGTRFLFTPIANPLTCRRFIETLSTQ